MDKEKSFALITSRWLTTHRLLFVVNLFCCVFAFRTEMGFVFGGIFWLLTLYLLYLHFRLAFDQQIFRDFALNRLHPEQFDQTLDELKLSAPVRPREIPERCRGAMKMWWNCLYATLAHALLFAL